MTATCYICAHKGGGTLGSPLPTGSPAGPTDSLGTCYSCSVLACSEHATRGGQYQCVICQHTAAVIFASVPAPAGTAAGSPNTSRIHSARPAAAAASAEAFVRGAASSENQRQVMRFALDRLHHDALEGHPGEQRAAVRSFDELATPLDEPNIITDFPSVVLREQQRQAVGAERLTTAEPVAPVDPQPIGGLSLEAIGAAGRETLFPPGAETSFGDDVEQIALGALLGRCRSHMIRVSAAPTCQRRGRSRILS